MQRPARGNSYNVQENHGDMQRKRFIPPLMQMQSAANDSSSTYVRNTGVLGVPEHIQTVPQNLDIRRPSTSAGTYVDRRTNANNCFNISEVSVQDNPDSNSRSTIMSGASSIVGFHPGNKRTASPNFKIFGSTEDEKMFIFTGTVERVIKWNKIFRNHFCYYEVIASVISIQEGSVNTQRIMLLRDKKGPILQVVYYNTTHIEIEDFHVEQVLRCVGRMGGPNILNAISIRTASQEEIDTLQRHCLACDQAISHFLSV